MPSLKPGITIRAGHSLATDYLKARRIFVTFRHRLDVICSDNRMYAHVKRKGFEKIGSPLDNFDV